MHKGPDIQNVLKALTPTGICTQCTNEDEEFVMKKMVFGEKYILYRNTYYIYYSPLNVDRIYAGWRGNHSQPTPTTLKCKAQVLKKPACAFKGTQLLCS